MGCTNSAEKKPKGKVAPKEDRGPATTAKTPKAKTPKAKTPKEKTPKDKTPKSATPRAKTPNRATTPKPQTPRIKSPAEAPRAVAVGATNDRSRGVQLSAPPPPPPAARPAVLDPQRDEAARHREEVQRLSAQLRDMQRMLDESRLQSAMVSRAVSQQPEYNLARSNSYGQANAYDASSDTDSPVLNDLMRPNPDSMYNDYVDEDDFYMPHPEDTRELKSPRLHSVHSRYNHSHAARLRNHQMTASEILEDAPPPPPTSHRLIRQNSMGGVNQVGSWSWWCKASDGYVKDGAAMTTNDYEGVSKLRNLRNALEAQMDGADPHSPVTLDVSTCGISSEGCHSLSVLLASPRVAHTAVVTTLDLSSNDIGDEGLGVVFQSLTHHAQEYQRLPLPMVRRLMLSKCGLKHGCGLLIALHLFFGEICLFPDLEELDLSFNDITPDAFRTILEAICSQCGASTTIRSVNFADCNLPPLALIYLQDTLAMMRQTPCQLRRMEVYGHRFGAEAEKIHALCPPGLELVTEVPQS